MSVKAKKLYCTCYLTLTPEMKKYVRQKLRGQKVQIIDDVVCLDNLDPKTEVLGVFVDSYVTKKVIESLPKLKQIVTFSTGYSHIDLKTAKKRKIPVCNVPSYGEHTVAEFAMGLILSLTRQIFPSVKRIKEGSYDYHGLRGNDIMGSDLHQKTVGIIGTGNIGKHIIRMLKGFDIEIIAHDLFPKKTLAKELGFSYVTLPQLLKKSDVISLHVPLFDSTYHMINKTAIKKMKKGVYIINTARGGLIDSEALLWGLEEGIVAGAGLDVLEGEDLLEDPLKLLCEDCTIKDTRISLINNVLIDHPKTIITPHIAFNTTEAVQRIIDTSTAQIKAFSRGEQTLYDVTLPKRKK
ncbi:hydroxyacid dehydrogenase [Patescibacteria group bacterium]|nr:hydroxyacid dehydrogenase [Patescibacteria group bacterium]MBU1721206.1 hydroxyacid dehydrogenase [Patescibacteria group bacterium]MBU1901086.1 hydroxyacid dehydrogenase [Patescibacteria group bacterium]